MTIPDSDMVRVNGGSCLPCGPEEEKRIVTELTRAAESNLREGNWYYVVSNRWFSGWQKYVGLDSGEGELPISSQVSHSQEMGVVLSRLTDRPGPIDNSDILSKEKEWEGDDLELRTTLQEGRDYVLVPEGVWQKLLNWYTGGPALPRKLISDGDFHKMFNVEVYPLRLKLTDSRDGSQSVIRISKKASIQELYERVFSVKGIKEEKARILDYFNKQKHSVLKISNQTLEGSNLLMDNDILLEVQSDGYWPSGLGIDSTGNDLALVPIEPSKSSFTIAGGPTLSNGHSTSHTSRLFRGSSLPSQSTDQEDEYNSLSTSSKGHRGGLGGLQNLGNTCFMNSALQCLVHTPPLVEYFLQDYSEEINKQNPLGMHGEIALAFGELLRRLWSCGRTTVAPRVFKGKLARFAPQFSGYNQHDSQELLAFLLDGLHEDLNRVKRKPYIEMKDSDGRPDEEVAEECWRNHKARNDSVIVDVCQGQYKSTLVCPVCGKISITFDPFMYLSLPLPSTVTRTMTITVFYGDGTGLPMPYTVTVLKHGCFKDLIQALGYACCLKTDESLLLAEVYDHRIYRYFENPLEPLSSIKDDEYIVAYRLPKRLAGLTKVELLHRCLEKCTAGSLKVGERKLLGTPLVTYVEDPQSEVDIDIAVGRMLSSLKRKTIFSSNTAHNSNGIGTVSVGDARMVDCNTEYGSGNQSINSIDSEDTFSSKLSFQLSLTDERGLSCRPVEKHSLLKAGQSVRVMMDWSNREYDLYDVNYLRDLPEVCKSVFSAKKTKQEAISLFSCLEAFLKEEPLGPDDMWYCPSCKEHRQATKKLDLWRLSDILVFHLKRFSYSRYLKNKIDTFVNFPIHNLDLSKYVKSNDGASDSHVYELYAISNHYGGLGGGHYSAYAKIIDEKNQWYHFDDSLVSPVNEAAIKTAAAYVLFYRRVRTGSAAEKGASRV